MWQCMHLVGLQATQTISNWHLEIVKQGNCETEIVSNRRPYLDRSRQWSAGVLGDRRKIHLQRSREPMQEGLNLVEAWESMEPLKK